jgi:hypothetical protein
VTSKFGLDWEIVLAAFMFGSAIYQGIFEQSFKVMLFFFIPCLVLMILQYRRAVILPLRELRNARQTIFEELDKIKKSQSDAPKGSIKDMKRVIKRAKK